MHKKKRLLFGIQKLFSPIKNKARPFQKVGLLSGIPVCWRDQAVADAAAFVPGVAAGTGMKSARATA